MLTDAEALVQLMHSPTAVHTTPARPMLRCMQTVPVMSHRAKWKLSTSDLINELRPKNAVIETEPKKYFYNILQTNVKKPNRTEDGAVCLTEPILTNKQTAPNATNKQAMIVHGDKTHKLKYFPQTRVPDVPRSSNARATRYKTIQIHTNKQKQTNQVELL